MSELENIGYLWSHTVETFLGLVLRIQPYWFTSDDRENLGGEPEGLMSPRAISLRLLVYRPSRIIALSVSCSILLYFSTADLNTDLTASLVLLGNGKRRHPDASCRLPLHSLKGACSYFHTNLCNMPGSQLYSSALSNNARSTTFQAAVLLALQETRHCDNNYTHPGVGRLDLASKVVAVYGFQKHG